MVEVSSINGILVGIECAISPYGSPESHTINRYDIFPLAVYHAVVYRQTSFLVVGTVKLEASLLSAFLSVFNNIGVGIDYHVCNNNIAVTCRRLIVVEVAEVECGQYLLLLVQSNIDILLGLQRRIDESQKESHDDHENGAIYNNVCIGVGIQPLFLFFHILF